MRDQSKTQIQQNSYQWNQVAYNLQTVTGKSSLKIIKLFKHTHRNQNAQYDNKEKIDSFVDVTDYKSDYKNQIIHHTIPLQDVIFFCGHINIKKYHLQPNKIFTFLLCKVSLGKIGKFSQSHKKIDSIFIPPQNEQPYLFNFLLHNQSQYQAQYEISFIIADDGQIKNKQIACSICQQNLATAYCKEEKMHFCQYCCNNHHHQIKIAHQNQFKRKVNSLAENKKNLPFIPPFQPHQIQKVNRINSLPLCENHSIKNQYFCLKCQKYLCDICVQKGTHNQNPQHVIKHIEYLYQQKSQANQTQSTRLRQKLEKLLQRIEMVSSSVTENYNNVRKKITHQFEQALERLQTLYFQKISKVYSDEIQLNMIYQRLQWSKAFIKHQQNTLKPIHYFKLQSRYVNEIDKAKVVGYQDSFNVKPDLDYYIDWHIGKKYDSQFERKKRQRKQAEEQANMKPPQNYVNTKNNQQHSILKFDSRSQAPKRGQLSLLLQNTNLHFFKSKFPLIQVQSSSQHTTRQ